MKAPAGGRAAGIQGIAFKRQRCRGQFIVDFIRKPGNQIFCSCYNVGRCFFLEFLVSGCSLAVFGAPQHRDDDADRAVECALAMQAAMIEVNALNEAEGFPAVNTGIAINTGDVIAGNIGSERRSKYGFVGHPMNVTSRIEDITAGGEILISDSTLQSLKGHYSLGRSQKINVKGIDETIVVHQVTGDAK